MPRQQQRRQQDRLLARRHPAPLGMGRFDDLLTRDDAETVRVYLIQEALALYAR